MKGAMEMLARATVSLALFSALTTGEALGQGGPNPADLVAEFATTGQGAAPWMVLSACPADSPFHAEVLDGLLALPLTGSRIEALALSWSSVKEACHQEALLPWFREAVVTVSEPQTARAVGEALGRMTVQGSDAALRQAALDLGRPEGVREQLQLAAFSHSAAADRVELFAEALSTGALTQELTETAIPFLVAGELRNEFAIRATEAVTLNPTHSSVEQVLMAVLYEATHGGGEADRRGLDRRTSAEVVRLLSDSGAYDQMEASASERVQKLAERVRLRGG